MKNYLLLSISAFILMSACVSPKVFKNLEERHEALKKKYDQLQNDEQTLTAEKENLTKQVADLKTRLEAAENQRNQLQSDYATLKNIQTQLKEAYAALEANSSAQIAENSQKNRELLAQLEAKEQALAAENMRLKQLQTALNKRSQQISELEQIIANKDAALTKLKTAVSNALTDFEGKGLTVNQRDGKVYVSMENKLLFQSGSWAVGLDGRDAVSQLGQVLANNPDIAILIEGHTDNVPYNGQGPLQGNWDLSAKRATSIVAILRENENINPKNLTVAGRSEYEPIATNETAEGRAKNRRIEIILSPKLDEITKLINNF